MPFLRTTLLATATAALLMAPAACLAGDRDSALELRARFDGAPAHLDPGPAPVRGVMGSATLRGLRLWASGARYAVARRSAGFGVAAGAALPVLDALALTAGYRIAGFSEPGLLEGGARQRDGRISGAYFGFDLEF